MKKKIKTVEQKLGREKAWAQTDGKSIEIDPRQRPKKYLDSLIHEGLHIVWPDESEACIKKTAAVICDLIWANNFRMIKQ